jgi:hypothetical protein
MLTGKQGKLKAVELEGTGMNLEYEVRTVMRQSANGLTVDQVAQAVAERAKDTFRSWRWRLPHGLQIAPRRSAVLECPEAQKAKSAQPT